MVLQVTVYRVADGLPLTGTTDIDRRPEVKHCHRYLKLVSRRLRLLPDRCVMHLEGFDVYLTTVGCLTFLALCEDSYPAVLAYCFLEEIQREFLIAHDLRRVNSSKRPYELIEFEMYLQRAKQRYMNTRSLSTKLDVVEMSTDLRLRPPYIVQETDIGVGNDRVLKSFKDTYRPTVVPGRRLLPITWIGMISIFLNIFCMALNLTRGMTIISHGHFDELDHGAYRFGAAFMLATLTCAYQVYLVFYYCRWRKIKTLLCLGTLVWCSYYLEQFRNHYQIAFHVSTAVFASIVIVCRKLGEKLPGYSV